jgi:hypothetical protein
VLKVSKEKRVIGKQETQKALFSTNSVEKQNGLSASEAAYCKRRANGAILTRITEQKWRGFTSDFSVLTFYFFRKTPPSAAVSYGTI